MTSRRLRRPVIAVVGPTASGKSALGIELALRMGGEIVNCDSVQVYKDIDVATAKVPLHERRGVAHHLIDFVAPEIDYTAGEYARDAAKTIEYIEARDRKAIIVGGTGFYLRALRRPFFESPRTDEKLRRRITRIRERKGSAHLHRILKRLDPEAAKSIHEHDWSRTQRALEVRFQTGLPISSQQNARQPPPDFAGRMNIIALRPPRQELYERINSRTEEHFRSGLVEEARLLLARGVPAGSAALGAHGYRRAVEFLCGRRNLPSAIEQTKMDVRHYAKRQLTWFRREAGARWFEGFGDDKELQETVFRALPASSVE